MKTNKPYNLKTKIEAIQREINILYELACEIVDEQDLKGQSTLTKAVDYSEVERWLVASRGFKKFEDYDSWAVKVGASIVTKMVYEWTGQRLTYPQIRKIAEGCLTQTDMVVRVTEVR